MPADPPAPFDVYSDRFTISVTPFGAHLSFDASEPHPVTAGAPKSTRLGTVRMSNEHLKLMVWMIRRQVLQFEESSEVRAQVAREVLTQLRIPAEDWRAIWPEK